jgi:hypothetical protein
MVRARDFRISPFSFAVSQIENIKHEEADYRLKKVVKYMALF